jgi:hypothetical protein
MTVFCCRTEGDAQLSFSALQIAGADQGAGEVVAQLEAFLHLTLVGGVILHHVVGSPSQRKRGVRVGLQVNIVSLRLSSISQGCAHRNAAAK